MNVSGGEEEDKLRRSKKKVLFDILSGLEMNLALKWADLKESNKEGVYSECPTKPGKRLYLDCRRGA